MFIPTSTAAQLLGMSTSHFTRLMKGLRIQSVSRRMGDHGRPEKLWSKCQLFALQVAGALVRAAGVNDEWADAFVSMVTTTYTDETLEAVFEFEKRGYVVVANGAVVPQFLTLTEAQQLLAENRETMGQVVSIAPLFTALMSAVRATREELA